MQKAFKLTLKRSDNVGQLKIKYLDIGTEK